MKSGNALEDREMRRRIDARRYPTITGDLKGMKQTEDGRGTWSRGDLTFRGVMHTYEDEMTVEPSTTARSRSPVQSTFDIRDFGMEPPRILMLKVQPEVTVRVEIVAEKEA